MDSYNIIFEEICSPLTGGASGGRNSEFWCRRAQILCASCSSRPYASFVWMWTPITSFPREISSAKEGEPEAGLSQNSGVVKL